MPDVNPIANSAKTISGGINSARDAGKELTKTIQSVQKDVTDVAIEQDKQRRKAQRNIEDKESLLVFKAIEEYERLNNILKKEEKAKADFINKHGLKEWNKVVQLKVEVEKEEKMFKKAYNSDLGKSKRAMMWCIFFASWITYLLYINKLI
jgi:hypothetical protein